MSRNVGVLAGLVSNFEDHGQSWVKFPTFSQSLPAIHHGVFPSESHA